MQKEAIWPFNKNQQPLPDQKGQEIKQLYQKLLPLQDKEVMKGYIRRYVMKWFKDPSAALNPEETLQRALQQFDADFQRDIVTPVQDLAFNSIRPSGREDAIRVLYKDIAQVKEIAKNEIVQEKRASINNGGLSLVTASTAGTGKTQKKAWTYGLVKGAQTRDYLDTLPITEEQLKDGGDGVRQKGKEIEEITEAQLEDERGKELEEITEAQLEDSREDNEPKLTEAAFEDEDQWNSKTSDGDDIKQYREITWRQEQNQKANKSYYSKQKKEKGEVVVASKKKIHVAYAENPFEMLNSVNNAVVGDLANAAHDNRNGKLSLIKSKLAEYGQLGMTREQFEALKKQILVLYPNFQHSFGDTVAESLIRKYHDLATKNGYDSGVKQEPTSVTPGSDPSTATETETTT